MVVRYRDYGFSESAVKKEIKELIEEMPAVSVAPEVSEMITPSEIELFDVYPNPFNPSTTISFSLFEQTIEKCGFADVRAADDCYKRCCHD